MGYLILNDYNRLIQTPSLQQIISGNSSIVSQKELTALEETKSYLRAKYDVEAEFTDTIKYNNAAEYKAANRVYVDALAYDPGATYVLGALTLQAGNVYRNTTAITVPEAFTIGKWELLGAQYDFYYCKYPKPVFDVNAVYNKNDQVFWKDKTYTAVISTQSISHEMLIQLDATYLAPYKNVFPDDPINGAKFWGSGVAYTVAAGKILDTNFFTKADNRNQQLVEFTIDICVYHLYGRIPPQIIPEERIRRYQTAISWLKNVAKTDDVVASIPKLQPPQGDRIRFGSKPKLQNNY